MPDTACDGSKGRFTSRGPDCNHTVSYRASCSPPCFPACDMPHNDSPVVTLHNRVVVGSRGLSFQECCPTWKRRPRRPKRSRFCMDLRLRHPLSVFFTWVTTPAHAGTWVHGKNSCLFLPCANFADPAVESVWERLIAPCRGHVGAPAYQNW